MASAGWSKYIACDSDRRANTNGGTHRYRAFSILLVISVPYRENNSISSFQRCLGALCDYQVQIQPMLSTRNRSWRIPTSDRLVRWQKPKGLVYFSLSSEFQPSKIVVVVRIDWFSGFYFRVTELINLGPNPKYTLSGQQQLHFRSFLQGRCIYITHCRCSVPGYNFGFWNRVTGSLRRRPWALTACLQYLHGIKCMHLSLFTIIKSCHITCRCFCVVRIFFGFHIPDYFRFPRSRFLPYSLIFAC